MDGWLPRGCKLKCRSQGTKLMAWRELISMAGVLSRSHNANGSEAGKPDLPAAAGVPSTSPDCLAASHGIMVSLSLPLVAHRDACWKMDQASAKANASGCATLRREGLDSV